MDKCKKHDVELKCMAGRSAHPSNWYCPACEKNDRRPQDVEEFIAAHEYEYRRANGDVYKLLHSNDLRTWMTGHVRVPVEPNDDAIVALGIALSIPRPDGETVADWAERIYKIALNASKGE